MSTQVYWHCSEHWQGHGLGSFVFASFVAAVVVTSWYVLSPGRGRLAVFSALAPQTVFNVVTLAVMPLYGLMVAFPRRPLVREAV